VPYTLVGQKVDIRATARVLEVFFKGERVASHRRSSEPNKTLTLPDHMPTSHREYLSWTPSRILEFAQEIGKCTYEFVEKMLESGQVQAAYRRALGVIRLAKIYGEERLEAACSKALALKINSYRSVENMLKTGFEREKTEKIESELPDHENLRGQSYYR